MICWKLLKQNYLHLETVIDDDVFHEGVEETDQLTGSQEMIITITQPLSSDSQYASMSSDRTCSPSHSGNLHEAERETFIEVWRWQCGRTPEVLTLKRCLVLLWTLNSRSTVVNDSRTPAKNVQLFGESRRIFSALSLVIFVLIIFSEIRVIKVWLNSVQHLIGSASMVFVF